VIRPRKEQKALGLSAVVIFLVLAISTSAFAGPPTGLAKGFPNRDQFKSDFTLNFSEHNAGSLYKPEFSGILEFPSSKSYVSVLPNCKDDAVSPCVKSFDASIDNGKSWMQPASSQTYATYSFDQSKYPAGTYIVQTQNWTGDKATLLPSGTDSSVFKFPKAPHFGGSEYLLQPIVTGLSSTQSTNARAHSLALSIVPIQTYAAPNPNTCSLWITTCFNLFNFKSDVVFRVVLDLKYLAPSFRGWFQSRIKDSAIEQLTPTEFSFTGSAINVSSVIAEFNKPYSEELIQAYPNLKTGVWFGNQPYIGQGVFTNTNDAINNWIKFEINIPKQATIDSSIWRAVSYSTEASAYIYKEMKGCLQARQGLLGQVSTNATAYYISAPLWNEQSDSLSFTVAAPTYESDGDKKQGLYDLVLREDVANCLWGKDLTKASAKIEILNADGTTQVATTTFKTINGYVYFRAAGFHYSVPNIKVSLVESLPKPRPPGLIVKKLRTITCTKGKVAKSVSAVNPKCPSGYKKKA
jgi:hypothetical protein